MKIDIVLGFDYGTKKIGVAVANMITRQASPIHTMKNTNLIGKALLNWWHNGTHSYVLSGCRVMVMVSKAA